MTFGLFHAIHQLPYLVRKLQMEEEQVISQILHAVWWISVPDGLYSEDKTNRLI